MDLKGEGFDKNRFAAASQITKGNRIGLSDTWRRLKKSGGIQKGVTTETGKKKCIINTREAGMF